MNPCCPKQIEMILLIPCIFDMRHQFLRKSDQIDTDIFDHWSEIKMIRLHHVLYLLAVVYDRWGYHAGFVSEYKETVEIGDHEVGLVHWQFNYSQNHFNYFAPVGSL